MNSIATAISNGRTDTSFVAELLGLVAAGRGVAFAPSDLYAFPHVGVVFVTLGHPQLTLEASAIWKRERETPQLRSFVDIMVQGA